MAPRHHGGNPPPAAPLTLTLRQRPEVLALCRLPAGAPPPAWLDWRDPLVGALRRDGELSIVCPAARVPTPPPATLRVEADWRALEVAGPLDFALVGLLADLSGRLARAGVSLFALSTFDTDLLLVRAPDLPAALDALCPPHDLSIGP